MIDYQKMQAIARPAGAWHEVKAQIVSQAQVDALVDWMAHHATGGVDLWVNTSEEDRRTWRLGCYGWAEAMPVTNASKKVNENNIYDSDYLEVLFEDRHDAMRFALLPEAGMVFGE